jgi:glutamate/tyrosine decarboxylase-like PLP-dependent enzyme
MIELKSMTAALSGEHYRNQLAMHDKLRELGWQVNVCRGAEEAKEVFKLYYKS